MPSYGSCLHACLSRKVYLCELFVSSDVVLDVVAYRCRKTRADRRLLCLMLCYGTLLHRTRQWSFRSCRSAWTCSSLQLSTLMWLLYLSCPARPVDNSATTQVQIPLYLHLTISLYVYVTEPGVTLHQQLSYCLSGHDDASCFDLSSRQT